MCQQEFRTLMKVNDTMKRYNNLMKKISDPNNIEIADNKARKNKTHTYGVRQHDKDRNWENFVLHLTLNNQTYTTSKYKIREIFEPKRRLIFKLPYWPDRIAHHAIMNILEPIWTKVFIKNTYSCIKGRGINKLRKDLVKDLKKFPNETKYCLKLDIRKFYPLIDKNILKRDIIRRKIKDKQFLIILDEIIDSVNINNIDVKNKKLLEEEHIIGGVPIGNYLSQFFANLYLSYFDHWIKEELKCKFYYRYADDMVILSNNKQFLHNVLVAIKLYLKHVLNLELKGNYQIFDVEIRGIDFVGYVFRHEYIRLRKSLKCKIKKLVYKYVHNKLSKESFEKSLASYKGWLLYCNSRNFTRWIVNRTSYQINLWNGELVPKYKLKQLYVINCYYNKQIYEIHGVYNHRGYLIKCKILPKYVQSRINRKTFEYSKIE